LKTWTYGSDLIKHLLTFRPEFDNKITDIYSNTWECVSENTFNLSKETAIYPPDRIEKPNVSPFFVLCASVPRYMALGR